MGLGLKIDCSGVQRIFPSGAVLLLAEIHRACEVIGANKIVLTRPREQIVDAVFNQIGIYDVLGSQVVTKKSDDPSVKHWRSATGVCSLGSESGRILEGYTGRLAAGLEKGLYDGTVEAMTNTVHHAYITDEGAALSHGIGSRWWLLSLDFDGTLALAFCDLGIGIPRSLPHSTSYAPQLVQKVLSSFGTHVGDVAAIQAAIELGKTRTGVQGRGKGLSEIVEAVNQGDDGSVMIASNRGRYIVDRRGSFVESLQHSVRGTLINWQVVMGGTDSDGGPSD